MATVHIDELTIESPMTTDKAIKETLKPYDTIRNSSRSKSKTSSTRTSKIDKDIEIIIETAGKKKLPENESPKEPAAKRAHIPSPPPEDDAANFPGIHSQTYGSKYSDHAYGQFGSSDGTEVLKYPIGQRIGRCTGGQATCVSGHIALAVAVQLRRSMGYEAKVDRRTSSQKSPHPITAARR